VDCSIVIATRDRADFLDRALDSLYSQAGADFEVVVADNGSSDGTQAVIETHGARAPFAVCGVWVGEPNRGKARNAALERASGRVVLFIDDDVAVPAGFVRAHLQRHATAAPLAVSGPIINVPSYGARPKPGAVNYSGAFFCTCNVSVPRARLAAAGGFDERFNLYGWEDTELGLRLRRSGVRRAFAWEAYLWHIKPPQTETFERKLTKSIEKGRMAAKFLERDNDWRARLATGAYAPNLLRAQLTLPEPVLPWLAGLAQSERLPPALRAAAESAALDGAYTHELRKALRARR
jgi:glycosyltransferase involved in cell wall biosynthesis